VIDFVALQMVLSVLTGWLDRREREVVAYLLRRTGSYGVNLEAIGFVLRTMIADGWRRARTESTVRLCGTSPRSRPRTPYCRGIAT
jgi:hypothetical protein